MKQKLINILSTIVFAIGVGVVAIFTRIKDLFTTKKEVSVMATICPYHDYPAPTDAQAMGALSGLLQMSLDASKRELACLVDCGTLALRYGAMKAFPHGPIMYGVETPPTLETCYSELAAELQPCLPMKGAAPESAAGLNINWGKVLQLVKFLLDLLGN